MDYGTFTHSANRYADLLTTPYECLRGQKYTVKGDIWQLGIVFFQLLMLKIPFYGDTP